MDKRLQLQADLKNNVSPKLKQIGKDLREVRRTPGMETASKWFDEFNTKSAEFVRGGGGAAGVISAIGIGGLTAAASLGALVAHFKELSERTLAMKELGREVGLTIDQINALNHAAAGFGVGADRMQGMINHLAAQMPQFRNGFGQLHDELARRFPDLTKKLKLEDTKDQLKDIFEFLGQPQLQKDPQLQKQMAELFFGSGEDAEKLFAKGGDAFMKSVEDYTRSLSPITKEMQDQAEALRKATLDFNEAITNLETRAGPKILKGMNEVLGEFNALFQNLERLEQWWDKHSPRQMADDAGKVLSDQLSLTSQQKYERYHGEGVFAQPRDEADAAARLAQMVAERDALHAALEADKAHPVGYAARHANDIGRLQDLNEAIAKLKALAIPADAEDKPRAKPMAFRSSESADGPLKQISFTGFDEVSGPIASGVKQGVLAAFRDWAQMGNVDAQGGSGSGFVNAAFETWDNTPGRRSGDGSGAPSGGQPPARGLYDAIAQAEGTTKDGFNTTLGYGKWGTPDRPLTEMTLDEVHAFGLKERRAQMDAGTPWGATSSANGKFQITGSTMLAAAKALGLDPSSTKFDGPTQERMAAWIARTQGLGAWEGFESHPDQLAAARRALQTGDLEGSAGTGSAASATDRAASLDGLGRSAAERAIGSRLTFGEWCADFVNGALRSSNMKGVNSSIANSFLAWGREVSKDAAKKGDVLVQDRGRGVGRPGGHVGLFTGNTRMRNGHLQMEMVSGNYGDRVNAHDWTDADRLHVRRGVPDLVGEERKSRPGGNAGDTPNPAAHTLRAEIHLKDRAGAVQRTSVTASAGVVASMQRWPQPSIA